MSHSGKNQTNPLVISATGYGPYMDARANRAGQKKEGTLTKSEKQSQAARDYWIRQNFLQDIKDYSTQHGKDLLRSQWECAADKRGLHSRVQWEVDKVTAKMDEELQKRRNRLSDLLKSEEDMYLQESVPQPEDPESKDARMLSRYKELKMQKEMDRQRVAHQKKEQQFKRNCDEFRNQMSRKLQLEAAEEGQQLVCERRCGAEQRNREESMYSDLWLRDAEAKRQREEREQEFQRQRDAEFGRGVEEQMQEKKMEKQRQLREKEADAEIRAEQERLAGLEEEWQRQMKKRQQGELKRGLDECLRAKLKRNAKEVQDDLMEDLYFLQQIMEDEEEAKRSEKKRALLKEQQDYLQHIRDQMQKEAEFEKEVDRVYKEELDKMWERRQKERAEDKDKRRRLERDVLKAVEDQIKANVGKSRDILRLNQMYSQKVLEEDQEDRRREAEKLRLIRERNAKHQNELLDQIRMKEEKLMRDQKLRDQELKQLEDAREAEEAKIQKLLAEMKVDNEHPYRAVRRETFNNCHQSEHCCGTKTGTCCNCAH